MPRKVKGAIPLYLTIILAGCGSSLNGRPTHPDYRQALKGAPPSLAKLYREANQLLPGGKGALERRIAEVGYPVIANVWSSWCGPCRYEFPMFQEVSAKFGTKIGFVGVDSEDSEKEAMHWLKSHPVPYPNYYEPGSEYAVTLKAPGPPDTAFYNAKGELVHVKFGQYTDASQLEEEIKEYALGGP